MRWFKTLNRKIVFVSLLSVSLWALAKVWGPFFVAAAGAGYEQTTLGSDSGNEYEAAQKLANMYLAPALNTPVAIYRALRDDYVRVVYYDGQIADFKIKRWPSTMPVDFDKTVPTVDTKRKPASGGGGKDYCRNGKSYTDYRTGYWGVESDGPTSGPPAPLVTITVRWISTGVQTVSNGFRNDCVK
ncbi:hypothetical protein LXT12_00060 [Pelomonas sp. P7]|uniref:Uncharacterized protein n=1 Tax=Pelomonas caseinilytica TaxID=2906763 RepID=A0ABS8X8B5_9BURK|nr:hypothetical protein [Pelomonas sp. P7]MCE4535655.1 hypothetical protein [Pelomonas sp. P7]